MQYELLGLTQRGFMMKHIENKTEPLDIVKHLKNIEERLSKIENKLRYLDRLVLPLKHF